MFAKSMGLQDGKKMLIVGHNWEVTIKPLGPKPAIAGYEAKIIIDEFPHEPRQS